MQFHPFEERQKENKKMKKKIFLKADSHESSVHIETKKYNYAK